MEKVEKQQQSPDYDPGDPRPSHQSKSCSTPEAPGDPPPSRRSESGSAVKAPSDPRPSRRSESGSAAKAPSDPRPSRRSESGSAAKAPSDPCPSRRSESGSAAKAPSDPRPSRRSESGSAAKAPSDPRPSRRSKSGSAAKAKHWRDKLKESPDDYNQFKEFDALRSKVYRMNMTDDKKDAARAKSRERQRKFRERKQAEKCQVKPTKSLTRSETEKQENLREYNKVKKREERANMSSQKRRRINEARRHNYVQEKSRIAPAPVVLLTPGNPMPTTPLLLTPGNATTPELSTPTNTSTPARRKRLSRARHVLPRRAAQYAETLQDLIEKASPRKKDALQSRAIACGEEMLNATVVQSMKEFIASLKSKRTKRDTEMKQLLAKSLAVSSKYISRRKMSQHMGIRRQMLSNPNRQRKTRKDAITTDQHGLVSEFFETHATILPGKKTVSKRTRKQAAVLQQSLRKLHKHFQREHSECMIAFSTFAKLRPRNIKLAKYWKLFQCLCEYCENVKYLLETANNIAQAQRYAQCVLQDHYRLAHVTLCEKGDDEEFHKIACIERKCSSCGVEKIQELYGPILDDNSETPCTWKRWVASKETNPKTEKLITVKKLEPQSGTVKELVAQLSADVKPLAQHLFTASWQQKQFSAISKHPPKDAVVQVLDFAENYTCQYQREIQSVHWHHTTVTLHPIVCYYQCADCEEGIVCETLAFISDDKVHDFHAVQTFVCLAMEHLRGRRQLNVQRVIQWTDGCASQYKSKGPFSDISHATSDLDCAQFERHFFGSRHGKGPSDGMSGLIKHHVDSAVKSNQAVVRNAEEMFDYLQQSFTKDPSEPCSHSRRVYFLVRDGTVDRPRLDRMVKTVAGTRHIHCVRSTGLEDFTIDTRPLSCFCPGCESRSAPCSNAAHASEWQKVELTPTNTGILFQDILHAVQCKTNSTYNVHF